MWVGGAGGQGKRATHTHTHTHSERAREERDLGALAVHERAFDLSTCREFDDTTPSLYNVPESSSEA